MFPWNKDKPLTQKEIMEEEKKAMIMNLALDPRPTLEEGDKANRKDQYASIMKWQQDRSIVLHDIFMGLAGLKLVKSDNGYKYEEDKCNKKICSEWGAKKITEFIRPQDHNAMLANWDEKKISAELFSIATSVMDYITLNNDELEISINNFEYICDEIVLAQHPTYQRGFNDGERKVIKETINVKEVSSGRPDKIPQRVFGIPISG